MKFLSALLILGFAANTTPEDGSKEVATPDICSFFEDPSSFEGQEATVTGRYVRTAHGYFLNPEGCPEEHLMVLLPENANRELQRIIYSQRPPSPRFDDNLALTGKLRMVLYRDWGGIPPYERPAIYVISVAPESGSG
jgi:hypothetical protein